MTKELNFFQSEVETVSPESLEEGDSKFSASMGPDRPAIAEASEKSHGSIAICQPRSSPLVKIREVTDTILPLRPRQLRQILDELKQEYLAQQRAFQLEEIAQGYVLRTYEEYAPYLDLLHRQKRGEKLSHASTEVLAIIAYRQPITRPQIDAIRGVDSSGTLMQLLERQLVEPVGKLEAPGRPTLYGTTKEFLKHYGLKDMLELKGEALKQEQR